MHGGMFEPIGYTRINEGGSHEENPNGGVQLGVDPDGVPNMVEEDESVYKDFVYSDNIKADGEMLKKHHLPESYAGKLYSEIADAILSDVEDVSTDAIALKGMEKHLSRLAEAQEEQKQAEQQVELEQELANLSPEELAELEAMLMQEEGGEGVPMEQPMVEPEVMPMMAFGGPIARRFDGGGYIPEEAPDTGFISQYYDTRMPLRKVIDNVVDSTPSLRHIQNGFRRFGNTLLGGIVDTVMPDIEDGFVGSAAPSFAGIDFAGKIADWEKEIAEGNKLIEQAAKETVKDVARQMTARGKAKIKLAESEIKRLRRQSAQASKQPSVGFGTKVKSALTSKPAKITAGVIAGAGALGAGGYGIYKAVEQKNNKPLIFVDDADDLGIDDIALYRKGGLINRYDDGGPRSKSDWARSMADDSWWENLRRIRMQQGTTAEDDALAESILEALANNTLTDDQRVQAYELGRKYGRIPDALSYEGYLETFTDDDISETNVTPKLPEPEWDIQEDDFSDVSPVQNMVIDTSIPKVPLMKKRISAPALVDPGLDLQDTDFVVAAGPTPNLDTSVPKVSPYNLKQPLAKYDKYDNPYIDDPLGWLHDGNVGVQENLHIGEMLGKEDPKLNVKPIQTTGKTKTSTPFDWRRHVDSLYNTGVGFFNMFQEPDTITPQRAESRFEEVPEPEFITPIYRRSDKNLLTNQILASGAGTARQIMSSGNPVTRQGSLLALDAQIGESLGKGMTQVDDANAERYNAVAGAINSQIAQKAKDRLEQARARASYLSQLDQLNITNDLFRQRYGNQGLAEWGAAVSTPFGQAVDSISKQYLEDRRRRLASGMSPYYAIDREGNVLFLGNV